MTPEPDPTPDPADKPDPTPDPAPDPAPDPKPDLTAADRAALEAVVAKERAATKAAEKAAREAQKKLDDIEAASLTETERLKKEAEEGKQAAVTATDKLRKANLIVALAEAGVTGAKAKAAARLLDKVEYDDSDEPTNLTDAITAATAEYGDDLFKGAKVPAPEIDAKNKKETPGPDLTPEEVQMAEAFGMTAEEYQAHKATNPPAPVAT